MTARELAAILMRHPDLPVEIEADDLRRYGITGARVDRERMTPGGTPVPARFRLSADWADGI